MFRKDSIPNRVIAFGRKLTDRIVEFDATDKYTKSYMSREFYHVCEEVNQELIAEFRQALPMTPQEVDCDNKSNIVMMRVLQVKHQECYVIAKQFFVKAKGWIGFKSWYQISEEELHRCGDINDPNQVYEFRCIGRNYSVPMKDVTVKDFYYKM